MAATILYLDTIPGERIQNMTLAGIRRYAAARGWDAVAVPREEPRPAAIPALLAARKPVAGCVVECSDGRSDLPPRLFGRVPVVYLHAAPSLYGGRGMRVNADNAAIAAAAFRELSAGRPDAYAVDVEQSERLHVRYMEFLLCRAGTQRMAACVAELRSVRQLTHAERIQYD